MVNTLRSHNVFAFRAYLSHPLLHQITISIQGTARTIRGFMNSNRGSKGMLSAFALQLSRVDDRSRSKSGDEVIMGDKMSLFYSHNCL